MDELNIEADVDNIDEATDFINSRLRAAGCPAKALTQIDIALDELFCNIARYAYYPSHGDVTLSLDILASPNRAELTLTDSGIAFDPLAGGNPDITKGAEEREIGGLGIFIVKKTMDCIEYKRRDGQNILKITKNF